MVHLQPLSTPNNKTCNSSSSSDQSSPSSSPTSPLPNPLHFSIMTPLLPHLQFQEPPLQFTPFIPMTDLNPQYYQPFYIYPPPLSKQPPPPPTTVFFTPPPPPQSYSYYYPSSPQYYPQTTPYYDPNLVGSYPVGGTDDVYFPENEVKMVYPSVRGPRSRNWNRNAKDTSYRKRRAPTPGKEKGKGYGNGEGCKLVWKAKKEKSRIEECDKNGGSGSHTPPACTAITTLISDEECKEKNGGSGSHPPPTDSTTTVASTTTPPVELGKCTTVMVKNIPNGLSRRKFIRLLDRHCLEQNEKEDNKCPSQYDFLYLPFDFKHGQNMGYAFVNFTTVEGASALYTCWNEKGWDHSPKMRIITPAKLQGIEQCRGHFQLSIFMCESVEFLPVEFSPPRDGSNGAACEMRNIGKWRFASRAKRSVDNEWWARTVNPPRLKQSPGKPVISTLMPSV